MLGWDTYALFGPGATWTVTAGPLLSSGSPVIDSTDRLTAAITPLLLGAP